MSNKVPIYIIQDVVFLHKNGKIIQLTPYDCGDFMFYTVYETTNKVLDFFNIETDTLHNFLPVQAVQELYREEKNGGYYEIHAEYNDKYTLSTSFENFITTYYRGDKMNCIVESWDSWNVYN
jgi:hypothetical protein